MQRATFMCTKQFVDCSNRGGYDPRDPCKHTCNDKIVVSPKPIVRKDPVMCTMQYVDCSHRGGYDPRDPCNHTCNDSVIMALQNLRTIEGSLFDMGDVDNH